MSERNLDVEFVKQNLPKSDITGRAIIGFAKATATTICIILALMILFKPEDLPGLGGVGEDVSRVIYGAMIISVVLAAIYYKSRIHSWLDMLYTSEIDKESNQIILTVIAIGSTVTSLASLVIIYTINQYIGLLLNLLYCSAITTGYVYWIYRNKLTTIQDYLKYGVYGIGGGCSAYGAGSLFIISIDLIGFWYTIAIFALELVFTTAYTYLDLLEWVKSEKRSRKTREERGAEVEFEEKCKDILKRMGKYGQ